jgi:hypothetical protein
MVAIGFVGAVDKKDFWVRLEKGEGLVVGEEQVGDMALTISLNFPHKVFSLQLLNKSLDWRLATKDQVPNPLLRIVHIFYYQRFTLAILL